MARHRLTVIALSDTHDRHERIRVPIGDILIHAGDFTNYGTSEEIEDFLRWFGSMPHKHKVLVAGNHESGLDPRDRRYGKSMLLLQRKYPDIVYLENESVYIEGLHIYGSPMTPKGIAFGYAPGSRAEKQIWSKIPKDVDILVTHVPPFKILDLTRFGEHAGSKELAKRLLTDVKPALHIFGHCHESRGTITRNGTVFCNAANVHDDHSIQGFGLAFERTS
ncbi:calcineurin-like phosphoesterase [Sicyoidochytrium minutum DNA virus]|nr:calcineurin-like phosphoesterase [Sicyoidochytrium minutum DNA virus]